MKILDMSAGNRAIWFNKKNPLALFIDVREKVSPDLILDSRSMASKLKQKFDLFVFDPPHVNFGKTSNMAKVYGHHTSEEIRDIVSRSSSEAAKLAHEKSLMAFKWNDHDVALDKILALMPEWEPLFGHLTRNGPSAKTQTFWVMLKLRETSC